MEPTKPAKSVLIILGASVTGAWALVIWIATEVTRTQLDTMNYIVELAQMS